MVIRVSGVEVAGVLAFCLSLGMVAVWAFGLLAGIAFESWVYVLAAAVVTGIVFCARLLGLMLRSVAAR